MHCGDTVISRFFNMITTDHLVRRITVRILHTSVFNGLQIFIRILPFDGPHVHMSACPHFTCRHAAEHPFCMCQLLHFC